MNDIQKNEERNPAMEIAELKALLAQKDQIIADQLRHIAELESNVAGQQNNDEGSGVEIHTGKFALRAVGLVDDDPQRNLDDALDQIIGENKSLRHVVSPDHRELMKQHQRFDTERYLVSTPNIKRDFQEKIFTPEYSELGNMLTHVMAKLVTAWPQLEDQLDSEFIDELRVTLGNLSNKHRTFNAIASWLETGNFDAYKDNQGRYNEVGVKAFDLMACWTEGPIRFNTGLEKEGPLAFVRRDLGRLLSEFHVLNQLLNKAAPVEFPDATLQEIISQEDLAIFNRYVESVDAFVEPVIFYESTDTNYDMRPKGYRIKPKAVSEFNPYTQRAIETGQVAPGTIVRAKPTILFEESLTNIGNYYTITRRSD